MDVLFSLNQDQQLVNSKIRLNVDKLELMYQFQFLYPCFHLQETKNQCMGILTFMERMELNSSLSGKQ